MSAPLTLLESADLLGRYRYVELAAFAALGERARSCSDPALACYLAGASLAHGWRARQVEERMPVSVGLLDVAACTRSPSPEVDEALALLAGPGDDADVLDGLLGALYPAMDEGYALRAVAASPACDPPVVRLIGRLRCDLDAVRREGLAIAGRSGPARPGRRTDVGALLARAGGAFGPLRARSGRGDSGPSGRANISSPL